MEKTASLSSEGLLIMHEKLVSIVIPVYRQIPDDFERLALEQCCRILGNYKISLVSSSKLNCEEYIRIFNKYKVDFQQIYFEDRFFKSIESYNELLLDVSFYKSFDQYEYILIYQLDAFVFRDELTYWCRKGYDYIGAPWFKQFWRFKPSKQLLAVGNGGFSLRKVSSCIRLLQHKGKFKLGGCRFTPYNSIFVKLKKLSLKKWKEVRFRNTVDFFVYINRKSEDRFWSLDTQNSHVPFHVAPIEEGIKFAFEQAPSYLLELNGGKLPFGCHAWNRYEPDFWKEVIDNELKSTT